MLMAKRVRSWRSRYDLCADGQPLGTWEGRFWRTGGTFSLAGRRYDVSSNAWGSRFRMVDELGIVVAEAERVGRKRWRVRAGGRSYEFRRASWWPSREVLVTNGESVGSVRRLGRWRRDTAADLPGMPLPVQVFSLVVVLTMWDARAAAAAAGA